jgi:hypothetical protein
MPQGQASCSFHCLAPVWKPGNPSGGQEQTKGSFLSELTFFPARSAADFYETQKLTANFAYFQVGI